MKENVRKAWGAVVEFKTDLFKKLVKNYTAIFKGGIVLVGLALAMLTTHMPQIMDYELTAKETEFEFQVLTGQTISAVDCDQIRNHQKLCLLAKYQASIVKESTGLFLMFYRFFMFAGSCLIGAAIGGFILGVLFEDKTQMQEPPVNQ